MHFLIVKMFITSLKIMKLQKSSSNSNIDCNLWSVACTQNNNLKFDHKTQDHNTLFTI